MLVVKYKVRMSESCRGPIIVQVTMGSETIIIIIESFLTLSVFSIQQLNQLQPMKYFRISSVIKFSNT